MPPDGSEGARMQSGRPKKPQAQAEVAPPDGRRERRILVIGEVARWHGSGPVSHGRKSVKCLDFLDVTTEILRQEDPEYVLSPLLCQSFDCLDLAIVLENAGFRGSYRVICENLPDPALVRREINARCPRLDFDVVNLDRGRAGRLN